MKCKDFIPEIVVSPSHLKKHVWNDPADHDGGKEVSLAPQQSPGIRNEQLHTL